jgi:predicted dehydrogenase
MNAQPDSGGSDATIAMAVIGSSGHAARVAAPVIAATTGARLAGVLGSTPERGAALAEQYPDCRAYAGWDDLAQDTTLDATWVAGPNNRHVEFAGNCLKAGKHVLLEKPMATSAADAQELHDLAEDRHLKLMVGFQHRFRPAHMWLRDQIREGLVGEPKLLRIHRFWPFPYFADMPGDASLSWRSSLSESGGWVLNDIGSHLIDLAQWLLDTPVQLAFARTSNFKFLEASAEDSVLLALDSGVGALITVETSNAMASFPGTIELHGSTGWARADGTFDGGGVIATHTGERRSFADVSALQANGWALEDFIAGIGGAPTIGATARQAAENVAIVEAAAGAHRN